MKKEWNKVDNNEIASSLNMWTTDWRFLSLLWFPFFPQQIARRAELHTHSKKSFPIGYGTSRTGTAWIMLRIIERSLVDFLAKIWRKGKLIKSVCNHSNRTKNLKRLDVSETFIWISIPKRKMCFCWTTIKTGFFLFYVLISMRKQKVSNSCIVEHDKP